MITDKYNENSEVKQLIIRLDSETKRKFNVKCVENNVSMQQVLTKYIFNYIDENNQRKERGKNAY